MKRTGILILMMLAAFAVSCRRRPLLEADYTVNVVMNLDRDIVNYTVSKDPSVMRVAFFDHSDGHLVTQAYLHFPEVRSMSFREESMMCWPITLILR